MQSNTTPAKGEFVRNPGQGYLFYRLSQPDVKNKAEREALAAKKPVPYFSVWQGWLMLPGKHEVQLRAIGSTRAKNYKVAIHEFGDTAQPEDSWKKLAEFEIPAFGEFKYQDASFKLGERTYKVRMFKTDDGYIRVRLPQVVNVPRANSAMV